MPHLALFAFNIIAILLILIFIRCRPGDRFGKVVYLALDGLIVILLIILAVICFRFSAI